MSIKVFLTNLGKYNEGYLIGKWVQLPVPQEKLDEVLEQIGINEQYEEYFITDWESNLTGLHDAISEYSSVVKLNELAEALEQLSSDEEDKLGAILEDECCRCIGDVMDLIDQMDELDLLQGIEDDESLGYYYAEEVGCISIPENIQPYFDYERFGRDIRLESAGTYSSYGYLEDNR